MKDCKSNKEIVYIADPEILSIPICDNKEPLIDIKNSKELRYGPPPECDLTKKDYTKIRKTVFEKLCAAQKDLPHGYCFRLYEGFRSINVQQMLFEQEYKRVIVRLPNLDHQQCFRETTRLISPVINLDGSKNIPPHNTGAAIDVEIVSSENKLLEMGMAIKDWTQVDPELCLTDSKFISKTARKNRNLLLKIMKKHGFVNYPTEWWHFSYGDRYWAYSQKSKQAIYGSAEEF